MNMELQYQITNFLNREALLLDNREFESWLELLSDDIVYRMPVRVSRETKDGFSKHNEMSYFEESKKSLTTRVKRFRTNSAWAEDPPLRTRHLVSNIIIEEGNQGELKVNSYFSVYRSRGVDHTVEHIFGERCDVVRQVNGQWKLVSRTIHPDQTVLTMMNLSTFL